MIPGITTKLSEQAVQSAATISVKADLVYLLGTAAVTTIIPNYGGGHAGLLLLIAASGPVVLNPYTPAVPGVSPQVGNILLGLTIATNRVVALVWSKRFQLWVISSGALP